MMSVPSLKSPQCLVRGRVKRISTRMGLQHILTRRKKGDPEAAEGPLARVLTTFDLVALGVGSTLGVGIYILAGEVARNIAGPAVVVSFLLAAVVAAFAGLSFAEFGSRVPKAGSAYIYSYYCVGELVAFIIGWSLILEYAIGAASVAKGISSYVDSLTNHALRDFFVALAPLDIPFLASFVDLFAMSLCLVLSTLLAFGVKESSLVNITLSSCNVCVVLFVIVCGFFKADFSNWNIPISEIPSDINGGEGGFAPFGISGIIKGAAVCFYGFLGFDSIATTGEEVKNPQRAIPVAIITSLIIILFTYFGVSMVVTLIIPYYLEDPDAPIPYAFEKIGWNFAKWIVGIGALFGLFSSLFGALFPLPRIIYSMASDGLLYRCLGNVHPRFQTPLIGTAVSGLFTAALAAVFNLQQLVGLNAIGTLLTYILVSVCVVILRFQVSEDKESSSIEYGEHSALLSKKVDATFLEIFRHFISVRRYPAPNEITSKLVTIEIFLFSILSICLSVCIVHLKDEILNGDTYIVVTVFLLIFSMLIIVLSIAVQPTRSESLAFKMPLVPYIPCINIFINIYLMIVLDGYTWIRFLACMVIVNQADEFAVIDRPEIRHRW